MAYPEQNSPLMFDANLGSLPLRVIDALLRASPDMIFVLNRAGQYVYVGVAAAQMVGWQPEAMLGKTLADLGVAPDWDAQIADLREQVLTTEQPISGEMTVPTVSGLHPFEFTLSPVRDLDGQTQAVLCIARDVADRKREEAALRESEERFRASFDQAAVGIAHVGIEGEWLRINQKLCDILGYSRDELLTLTYLHVRHPDDIEDGRVKLKPLLSGDLSTYTVERRYLRKDRSIIWGNLTISLVRDASNTPSYYVCVIEDITARKEVEQQKAQIAALNGELHLRLQADITHLKAAQEEIVRLNERLHRAVYESSHRIKNQLQVLSATADLVLMDGQETVSADALRRLRSQIEAVAATHDLLTQETRGDGTADHIPVRALLERALTTLQQTTARHLLQYTLTDVSVTVKAAMSLALLLNEAVSNAIKHGGGIVEVTLLVNAGQGRLEICDNGPGFPEGFDAYRAANTGLELVMTLTRTDLRGTVEFTNRAEGGAKVVVVFPLFVAPSV